ncbi:MAG: hypothetical protein K2R93_03780 [Gemmatimonadaceae bacterium]|nr:hypothetical protein [Gemmatimonadaceae bacterium]
MQLDFLPEPALEFGGGMSHIDIRFGLMQYGPLDITSELAPRRIKVGVVGTPAGTEMLREWLERCRAEIGARESRQRNLFPRFPGFAEDVAFGSTLVLSDETTRTIADRFFDALRQGSANEAIQGAVDLFLQECRVLSHDHRVDVVVCVVPMRIAELMDPALRDTRTPSAENDDAEAIRDDADERDLLALNFRDLLKAKAMGVARLNTPIQLILPSSLNPTLGRKLKIRENETRSVQDEATRAWNFHTALYYKAGGRPWRIPRDPRQFTTCHVGISFYESLDRRAILTSMAQVFDERGDGVVVRGGPIQMSKDDRVPHLTALDSEALLMRALARYRDVHKNAPARVVVHKSSPHSLAELEGFDAAATRANIEVVDCVSIGRRPTTRLFRYGNYPPLRGTYLHLDARDHLLYTRGSVNFFETYPGSYVPRPLLFRCDRVESTPKHIAREMLGLSKLNWNVTQFDGGTPITIEAARRVGKILKHLGDDDLVGHQYAFYM